MRQHYCSYMVALVLALSTIAGCASQDLQDIGNELSVAVKNLPSNMASAVKGEAKGVELTDAQLNSLTSDTDAATVEQMFGKPTSMKLVNGKAIWHYSYSFSRGVVESSQTAVIRFNRDNKVERAFVEEAITKGKAEHINTVNPQRHGVRITPEQMAMLDPGMSYEQVESVLGMPSETKTIGSGQAWFYYFLERPVYGLDKHEVTVIRFDDEGSMTKASTDEGRMGSRYLSERITALNKSG